MSTAFDDQSLDSAVRASVTSMGVTKQAEIELVVSDAVTRLRSIQSVGAALAKLPTVAPGSIRSIGATENAWRRIEAEFGLLTSTEVAARVGSRSPHRNLASELRQRGQLLAVTRLNAFRYPGFQFADDGSILPVIPALISAATDAGWSSASLILWLCNPSGSFGGGRPVDHLDAEDLVDLAVDLMATDW